MIVEAPSQTTRLVVPYKPETQDWFDPGIKGQIFDDLKKQELLDEIIHEKNITKGEFIQFLDGVLWSLFIDREKGRYIGLAWLNELADTVTHRRAFAGIVFFRDCWKPEVTSHYARIQLSQWFYGYEPSFDLICAMIPRENRLSRRFVTRFAFQKVAELPGFTSYHGQRTDAIVYQLEKERWELFRHGQKGSSPS